MKKAKIFNFLRALSENNHKDWMDVHREAYHEAKAIWLSEIETILKLLGKYDPTIPLRYRPKDTISRINNNRRFQPDKPVYKDYFTFSIMDETDAFSPLYIMIGASGSFIGTGYHQPDNNTLNNIRDAIDYEGQELIDILDHEAFKSFFGGLSDYSGKLKTAPRGFDKDHEFVELLRYKNFVVSRDLTEEEVISREFIDIIEKAYIISEPFRSFLKKANSLDN